MKQSQGYLTGVQQNLANTSGGLQNQYFGGSQPQVGNTFGYGSTVPHFSWTGQPYFSGNGTDTPTPMAGIGSGQTGGFYSADQVKSQLMPYLQSLGGADSNTLERALPQIQRMFPGTTRDNSGGPLDEIVVPGVGIIDLITGAEGNGPKSWSFQTGGGGGFGGGGGGLFGQAQGDYSGLMGMGRGLFGNYLGLANDIKGSYAPFIGAASNMAQTGGLSDADQANLRARAISPIRAVYANSLRNVDRQRSLQGGYSPGYTTAMGRFNREMGQGVSDATTNAEAAIAELVQRGKLGGLSAWGSGLGGRTSGMLGAYGGAGNTLGTMGSLYGTQPGMANLFGSQMLQAQGQNLTAAGLQNQLSLGLMNNQNNVGQIPGNYQNALSNIGGTLGIGAGVGSMIAPWLGGGGMGMNSTSLGQAINPNSMFAGYGM